MTYSPASEEKKARHIGPAISGTLREEEYITGTSKL